VLLKASTAAYLSVGLQIIASKRGSRVDQHWHRSCTGHVVHIRDEHWFGSGRQNNFVGFGSGL